MLVWKDVTSRSRGDTKESKPTDTWETRIGRDRITVHKYLGLGNAYFVTCHGLQIDRHDLGTKDPATARRLALAYVRKRLSDFIDCLDYNMGVGEQVE